MMHWRTIFRIFLESLGELMILFAAIYINFAIIGDLGWKVYFIISLFVVIGITLRTQADKITLKTKDFINKRLKNI